MTARILPVLDVQHGICVRAVRGERSAYAPLKSTLAAGSDPSVIRAAFAENFGLDDVYVADLDGICNGEPQWCVLHELSEMPGRMMADIGVRCADDVRHAAAVSGCDVVIAGECLSALRQPEEYADAIDPDRLIFSLDLFRGRLLGASESVRRADPFDVVRSIRRCGIRRLIVLDVAAVGDAAGCPVGELCRQLAAEFPDLHLISGGGIRNRHDIRQLAACGVSEVLLSTALHNGQLTPSDWVASAADGAVNSAEETHHD